MRCREDGLSTGPAPGGPRDIDYSRAGIDAFASQRLVHGPVRIGSEGDVMKLRLLQRNWDQMGATDPLWAVATAPQYRGGKWNEAAFFATGVDGLKAVMDWAGGHGLSFP